MYNLTGNLHHIEALVLKVGIVAHEFPGAVDPLVKHIRELIRERDRALLKGEYDV